MVLLQLTGQEDIAKKPLEQFRVYYDNSSASKSHMERVRAHYQMMRKHQTLEFHRKMEKKWHSFDKAQLTVKEAFDKLRSYIDSSDPDNELPNIVHDIQTAEAMRKDGLPDWIVLVGLLHDVGKIMYLWGDEADGQSGNQYSPQWALGGDTWVLGAPIPASIVYPEFNHLNPDEIEFKRNGKFTIYSSNCGLDQLKFSYGHDEYMYRVLLNSRSTIPYHGLQMIRLHSCYVWHTHGEYEHLMTPEDFETREWVKMFNKYDLYTKADEIVDESPELWEYYSGLAEKYIPNGILRF